MTPQQTEILEAIRQHLRSHGYAPSVRDLARICGYATPSAVTFHLKKLEASGHITRTPNTPRSIRLGGKR